MDELNDNPDYGKSCFITNKICSPECIAWRDPTARKPNTCVLITLGYDLVEIVRVHLTSTSQPPIPRVKP